MQSRLIFGLDILPGSSPRQSKRGGRFALAILREQNRSPNNKTDDHEINKNGEINAQISDPDYVDVQKESFEVINDINILDLITLTRRHKPAILAVDNLMEIASNEGGISQFARKIPEQTQIVQVTGDPKKRLESLKSLSERHGLRRPGQGHPSPSETASLLAMLAKMGVGYKVVSFEDEVRITVSKNRVIGHGGWSAPRFERNMVISVQQFSREISQILSEAKLEFDHFEYPKRQVFIVRPDQDRYSFSWFRRLQGRLRNDLAEARVQRIPKSNLEYVPLSNLAPVDIPYRSLRTLVVGVDPGTTVGIAILDAKTKELTFLDSFRDIGTSQLVRLVSDHGKAVMLCTDVIDTPHALPRLARHLGASLHSPRRESAISRAEKRSIVQDFLLDANRSEERTDTHQRDALYAAIIGYNSFQKTINKIREVIQLRPEFNQSFDYILSQTLTGVPLSVTFSSLETRLIADSLRQKLEQQESTISPILKQEVERLSARLIKLEKALLRSEEEKIRTEQEATTLRKLFQLLKKRVHAQREQQIFELDRDARIEEKLREIVQLKREIVSKSTEIERAYRLVEILKKFKLIWAKGTKVPIKAIPRLHEEDLYQAGKEFGISSGDIVLVLDPQGGAQNVARTLAERNIRAVLTPRTFLRRMSHLSRQVFEEAKIPLLEEEIVTYDPEKPPETRKDKLVLFDDLYVADKKYINRRISQADLEYIKRDVDSQKRSHQLTSGFAEPQLRNKSQLEILLEDYQISRKGLPLFSEISSGDSPDEENSDF